MREGCRSRQQLSSVPTREVVSETSGITTTVIGAYPKIGDDLPAQSLRRALHQFDRGEIDRAALDAEFDRTTARVAREMDAAGVDVLNHGCVRWDDLFSPFVRVWSNVSAEALERYFDNNTYFRVPLVNGTLEPTGPATVHEYEVARKSTGRRVKGAVCGPLTFARLADDRYYRGLPRLARAAALAVRAEIAVLQKAGCDLVDIEEPALARWPEDWSLAVEVYEEIAQGHALELALHLPMFPADALAERLAGLSVAQLGVDLCSRPTRILERLELADHQTVVLGAVDARNTKLEAPADVARHVDAAVRRFGEERVWIAPTTSLEYLPHDVARAKLRVLVEGATVAVAAGGAR